MWPPSEHAVPSPSHIEVRLAFRGWTHGRRRKGCKKCASEEGYRTYALAPPHAQLGRGDHGRLGRQMNRRPNTERRAAGGMYRGTAMGALLQRGALTGDGRPELNSLGARARACA